MEDVVSLPVNQFPAGNKAVCKKTHKNGYLKIGKAYSIVENGRFQGVQTGKITDFVVIPIDELEHSDGTEANAKNDCVAFSTEYFDCPETEMAVLE